MTHRVLFSQSAWQEYQLWQRQPRMLKRIEQLIRDIDRDPDGPGIGKPEQLRGALSGWSSRRINDEHRLVYRVKDGVIQVLQCYGHYDD